MSRSSITCLGESGNIGKVQQIINQAKEEPKIVITFPPIFVILEHVEHLQYDFKLLLILNCIQPNYCCLSTNYSSVRNVLPKNSSPHYIPQQSATTYLLQQDLGLISSGVAPFLNISLCDEKAGNSCNDSSGANLNPKTMKRSGPTRSKQESRKKR